MTPPLSDHVRSHEWLCRCGCISTRAAAGRLCHEAGTTNGWVLPRVVFLPGSRRSRYKYFLQPLRVIKT
jgi:hypothetical protein